MRIAQTTLLVLPLCAMLLNSASAALVITLVPSATVLDYTMGQTTTTIDVRAQEDTPGAPPSTFFFSSLNNGGPNPFLLAGSNAAFTTTTTITNLANAFFSGSGSALSIGTITVNLNAMTAAPMTTASIRLVGVVTGHSITGNDGPINSGTALAITAVPEPGTFGLLAFGGMGLTLLRRRRA